MKKLLLLLFFIPTLSFGADFSAKATLSRTTLPLDKTMTITLDLTYPEGWSVDANALEANLLDHSLLSPAPFLLQSRETDGQTLIFTLEPQLTGKHPLTFRDVTFTKEGEKPVTLISTIFEVTITPASPSGELLLPQLPLTPNPSAELNFSNRQALIKNQSKQPEHNVEIFTQRTLPWEQLALAVVFIGVVVFALLFLRKEISPEELQRRRRQRAKKRAKASLKALQTEAPGPYTTKAANTVRRYFEERFGIHAPQQTTPEFLKTIAGSSLFSKKTEQKLAQFLQEADRMKFSAQNIDPEACEKAKKAALDLIKKT